ncbi:MAG: hypothetical protein M3Q79_04505, partial [bacterium]|nr:hypothetical protein [bacterium]
VESRMPELVEKYGGCFPRKFNPATLDFEDNQLERADSPPANDECKDGSTDLKRYSAYMAARSSEDAISCYEGDEASCGVSGFAGSSGGSTSGGLSSGPTAQLNGFIVDGIQIDSVARSCTGGLQEGAEIVAEFVKSKWGASYNGYDCRSKSTGSALSIHAEGRAIDQMYIDVNNPAMLRDGNANMGWAMANAREIGIQYVKFWKLQWSPTNGLRCVTNAADIQNHSNHVHYELNWPAARMETPWFTNKTDKPPITINQAMCSG